MIRDVEIKILDKRVEIPKYATMNSGAFDLVACIDEKVEIAPLSVKLIPTGISVNMMSVIESCAGLILPRSGNGHKRGMVLGNGTGYIDEDYAGQLFVSVLNRNSDVYLTIEPFERIAQFAIVPIIRANFIQVEEFTTKTERGAGGFGSTGK